MKPTNDKKTHQNTLPVNDKIFQAVYDSPSSFQESKNG